MSFDIKTLSNKHVLVVGDVMLDQYTWGNVSRISPEAPVPIVRVNKKSKVMGGAANVASNLSGLGCKVTLIGLRGNDSQGNELEKICKDKNIDVSFIIDPARPTTTKTRIMASKQQLFRLDEEEILLMSESVKAQLLDLFKAKLSDAKVVILSDYGKGILQTPGVCKKIIDLCKQNNIPSLIDPKGKNWERYTGATCITPNTAELETITDSSLSQSEEKLTATVSDVKNKYDIDCLLLTRGEKGMCIVDSQPSPLLIPTVAREVFDVSGAGDTVISTFAAGISAGFSYRQSAELANTAAGVVVGKVGTQPITSEELDFALRDEPSDNKGTGYFKADSAESTKNKIDAWKTSGDSIVFTNGCFDLLHPGHVDLLYKSRALGNRLIVGLNSDSSVQRLKGATRPILAEGDRAAILSALACVDLVVLFDEDTPLELLQVLKPDILVKGSDYNIEDVVGRSLVESHGGKVCLVPLIEGYSTSSIEKKIIETNKP